MIMKKYRVHAGRRIHTHTHTEAEKGNTLRFAYSTLRFAFCALFLRFALSKMGVGGGPQDRVFVL